MENLTIEHPGNKMTNNNKFCPFCTISGGTAVIAETHLAYAIYDRFPVNPGHSLIIPKRHCADYFELTPEEQSDAWEMVNRIKDLVEKQYCPDGYNIGINNSEAAGQTIPHVHIHIIPRYHGDVVKPQGGIRGVIPERKEY